MGAAASVVVTSHNYEQFVAEALESVLDQTERCELVVVDDGSTDASPEIIRRYGEVATVLLQANAGQTAAMNAGFSASTGDIVVFLDADDRLAPTAMERVRDAMKPGVVAAHWRMREIDRTGRPTGGLRPQRELAQGDLRALLLERGPDSHAHPPTSGNAWSRWFLDRVMPLPVLEQKLGVGSASADALLAALAPLHGLLARVVDGQADYRLHDISDYSGTDFAERLRRDLATYDVRLAALAEAFACQGVETDSERWRECAWLTRLARATAEIDAAVPAGQPFLLVDHATWGMEELAGRRAIPFLERDGRWWGPPESDAVAVAELERAREGGVGHVVVGWPAWWWLETYAGMRKCLYERARVLRRTPEVAIFAFEGQA